MCDFGLKPVACVMRVTWWLNSREFMVIDLLLILVLGNWRFGLILSGTKTSGAVVTRMCAVSGWW